MLNTPTVYVLLGGYVHQEPKLYGIYDNLDSLREAVVEIATPIREEMQRVLPYRECLLKANRDWGVTGVELERMATYPECLSEKENLCGCHLNAEKRENVIIIKAVANMKKSWRKHWKISNIPRRMYMS